MAGFVELFQITLSKPTESGPANILEDFSLNVSEGEIVSLLGPRTSAKSDLINLIAGLTIPSRGAIAVARREIDGPGTDRGLVFQFPNLLPWLTSLQNVQLGVDSAYPFLTNSDREEIANHFLNLVGVQSSADQLPRFLTPITQFRVSLARALAINPKILILDDPFHSLSPEMRWELLDTLQTLLAKIPITALLATDDVEIAIHASHRVISLTGSQPSRLHEAVKIPFAFPRSRDFVSRQREYPELRYRLLQVFEQVPANKEPMTSTQEEVSNCGDGSNVCTPQNYAARIAVSFP